MLQRVHKSGYIIITQEMPSDLANKYTLRFNGIRLKNRDRELITVILDESVNEGDEGQTHISITTPETIKTHARWFDYNSQVRRSRERLEEAGLLDVAEVDSDGPLAPTKAMKPTEAALEERENIRVDTEDLPVEERVDRLEEDVDAMKKDVSWLRNKVESFFGEITGDSQ